MDHIKTLTDIHLFADSLIYRFEIIPANMKITIDLYPYEWDELSTNMDKLPQILKHETNYLKENGVINYKYEGIGFKIKLKNL